MISPCGSSSRLELLLTSAGPTTEAIQERLLEMALAVKPASHLDNLRILRVADGWQKFDETAGTSFGERIECNLEAAASRLWSRNYIGYVLGEATITTGTLGSLNSDKAEQLINEHDIILVPGGNTWQTIKGLYPHKDVIGKAAESGMPFMGESAGSIIAGLTTRSAMLPPADTTPQDISELATGLGLVDFDVVVHASGRKDRFSIPGPLSRISSLVLRSYETHLDAVDNFVKDNYPIAVEVLNDSQAIAVSQGNVIRL